MTDLQVDVTSAVPVYEQIRSQVAAYVAVGALRPGDRLPSARDLARDLGVAVGTVQRAYRELEARDVVVSRRRTGTVVAERPVADSPLEAGPGDTSSLVAQMRAFVAQARAAGLTDEGIQDLLRGALRTDGESPGSG
ncbi:GntR family transcriptional regulator [Nocardioides limicola]|uniref:GntR family transcriptional regulator n=1 Tax=Nocardioides limicola TaxID=2803368 RepID=UPI00193B84AE|nr:GntR family transcriptional regulator [Nocardioides sp. DJM-14]